MFCTFLGAEIFLNGCGRSMVKKRRIVIAAILIFAVISSVNPALVADAKTSPAVTFTDAAFESVVRTAIGKPAGAVTQSDLIKIKSITFNHSGIGSLTDIKYLTALTDLSLISEGVSDLSPLRKLSANDCPSQ
jgi:hypothetical protein